MPTPTTYTYSIANDFPNGKIDAFNLQQEIVKSSIVTALDNVSTSGDVVSILFKDVLSNGDRTTLDANLSHPAGGLIAAHNSTPPTTPIALQFMDSIGISKPGKFDPDGKLIVSTVKPTFAKDNRISFNLCDKTTWYEGSLQVTDETLVDGGDHLTFNSAHQFWIDLKHGNVWQEDTLMATNSGKWVAVVKINGTTAAENSPGQLNHDYSIDYAAGHVVFNQSQNGNTITATYWYASSSIFTMAPQAGQAWILSRVELQFSDDIELMDTVHFQGYGYVQVFAPQYCPNPYPVNTLIPLGPPLKYKAMSDYYNESNGAYPVMPALSNGGGNWRGMDKNVVTLAWDYLAGITLHADYGMSLTVTLETNTPHGGTYATATFYAVTYPENDNN